MEFLTNDLLHLVDKQGSIYYIENHIPPPLSFGDHIISPYIYLQECKNKHIFDHFVLVYEQIVFINFHFLSPLALSAIFPSPQGGGIKCKI